MSKKITEFFNKVKTVEFCEVDVTSVESESAKFYQECLKKQETQCRRAECVETKLFLQSKLHETEKKNENRKKQIEICSSVIAEKEHEIECLEKQLDEKFIAPSNSSTDHIKDLTLSKSAPDSPKPPNSNTNTNETLNFDGFSEYFTEPQLADLRFIGPNKREDSKFVSVALRSLYEGRLDVLKTKSITGRTKPGAKKEKFPPENMKTIHSLFAERIATLTTEPNERVERKKNVNKYIKDAQNNISKKENVKETARQLHFD